MQKQVEHLIIGGGITGLALGARLKRQQHDFLLIEPQMLGGMICSELHDGFILECGPNVFVSRAQMMELLGDLGLQSDVVYARIPNFRQLVWDEDNHRIVDVPRGPLALLKTSALTLGDKLSIVSGLFRKNLLQAEDLDLSVADLFLKLGSRKLVYQLLDGGLKGLYGGNVKNLSARSLFPNLWQHLREGGNFFSFLKKVKPSRMFMLRHGNSSLVSKLVEALGAEQILKDKVRLLSPEKSGYRVALTSGQEILAKNVYITTSGATTADFLGEEFADLTSSLREIKYSGLAVVHFEGPYDAQIPEGGFGLLCPGEHPKGFLGVMFSSHLFPHMAPLNRQLFTCFVGGVDREALFEQNDVELAEVARAELLRILSLKDLKLLRVTRWPRAVPQLNVGYYLLQSAFEAAEAKFPGLKFLGTDQAGIGVSDRIKISQSLKV